MWVASCTKLVTAVAVLQCVEKGLLNLDEEIATVLTEWRERSILLGFDDASGEPLLEKANGPITLRMLLTHQSGLGYAFIRPELKRFVEHREAAGELKSEHIADKYFLPLLFEPGSSWEYGVGADWAGRMVERVTNQNLGAYMQEYIFDPLGMDSTTFRLRDRLDIKTRRADMTKRQDDGSLTLGENTYFSDNEPDDHGGGGLFSSARDYLRFLSAVLKHDEKLLNQASFKLLFAPCLLPAPAEAFQDARSAQHRERDDGHMAIPAPEQVDFALGGMVTLKDVPGGRKAGSLSWGGLPNLSWLVDRDSGMAIFFASQTLPPGDKISGRIIRRLEAAVYSGEFFKGALRM
ncbi:putative D-aminoacylase [Thozetella sp. PMI_491]|nr:putative D-aminoacylase [Thozetella sp. PMI_491]